MAASIPITLMYLLLTGLLLFFSAHSLSMWRSARQSVIDNIGFTAYRTFYSLVSLLGFALIVSGYGDAPKIALWTPPAAMRGLTMALMLPVFVILIAAYLPGHIKARLKNPMLIALKTWAFAHLLVNGDLASGLLFGSFLLWAVLDLIAVKRSGRGAIVQSPKAIFDLIAVAGGLAIYALVVFVAHQWLAGIALL